MDRPEGRVPTILVETLVAAAEEAAVAEAESPCLSVKALLPITVLFRLTVALAVWPAPAAAATGMMVQPVPPGKVGRLETLSKYRFRVMLYGKVVLPQ